MPAGGSVARAAIVLLMGCYVVHAGAAGVRPEFQAVQGELAALPCNISTPLADDAASLILWYREDLPNPIYTLDIRRQPRHFPSPEVEGRAYFDTADHPPLLKIFPVKKADRGDYKCRVDLRRSRTFIHYTRLVVIVPPKVVITDEYGQTMRDVIGPYDEGSSLELFCEASDGEPHPWVTWWRGSVLIDDTFNITPQQVVRNELLLPELKRSDLLVEYSCQAANTNLTKPRVQAITLDLNLRPLSVKVLPPQPPLSAGQPSQLQCEAAGARPVAAVSWWRGGRRLPLSAAETSALSDPNRTLSTLSFVPKVEDHGQTVMCEAAHPTLEGVPVQDTVELDVHYAPQLALTLGTSDPHASAIKEGVSVYFDCNVRANPQPDSVAWWVDGRPLGPSGGVLPQPRSLVLEKVGRGHRGSYQCSAQNDQGEGRSDAVKLDVQYSPVCVSASATVVSVAQGEAANLSCGVDANPPPSAFQWTLNSSLRGTVDLRRRAGGADLLSYVPRYLGDFGTVLCWGRNEAGVQRRPCVWHLSPEGEVSTDMGLLGPSPEDEEEEEEVWPRAEEESILSPAVGVVIGVVLSLVVLVLVVIVVVKIHTHPPQRRTYFEEEKLKYPSPIKKEPTDSIGGDGNEKSPDIIPLPSDIEVYATTVAVELCPTSPILPKQSVEAYYTVENQTCV